MGTERPARDIANELTDLLGRFSNCLKFVPTSLNDTHHRGRALGDQTSILGLLTPTTYRPPTPSPTPQLSRPLSIHSAVRESARGRHANSMHLHVFTNSQARRQYDKNRSDDSIPNVHFAWFFHNTPFGLIVSNWHMATEFGLIHSVTTQTGIPKGTIHCHPVIHIAEAVQTRSHNPGGRHVTY